MQGGGGRGGVVILLTEKRGRGTGGRFFLSFSFLPFFFRNEPLLTNLATPPRYFSPRNYFPLLRISKLVYTLYIDRLTTLKRISSPPSSIRTYYCDYKYFSGRR